MRNCYANEADMPIEEQEADYFARCILMPKDWVDMFVRFPGIGINPERIADRFGVPVIQAFRRLRDLGYIERKSPHDPNNPV